MIEEDTVRLLRECGAGVRMGVQAIDEALPHAQAPKLRTALEKSKNQHLRVQDDADALLRRGFSWSDIRPALNRLGEEIDE